MISNLAILLRLEISGWEKGFGKGSFQKCPFSRDSREFRDSRDPRDSSSEKTLFIMTHFPVPKIAAIAILRFGRLRPLVAPYCAILRDYLSDTPLLRAMGFWCLNRPIGCDTPSTFSERFPLWEHARWRCDPPPLKGGISAILARYPMKTRQFGAIPPLRYYLERVLRDMGGYLALGR